MMSEEEQHFIAKCRGLPCSATTDEIFEFFKDCHFRNGSDGIHIIHDQQGRPSGEAFIEFASAADLDEALKNDRQSFGSRYVEVSMATKSDLHWAKKSVEIPNNVSKDNVVRLRGIPYGATKQDVAEFFNGLEITDNGILLTTNRRGRASGEGYVQFASSEHLELALQRDRQNIGSRYIEVFRSSMQEAESSKIGVTSPLRGGPRPQGARPGPYDRPPMRGGRGSRGFRGGLSFGMVCGFNPSFRRGYDNNLGSGYGMDYDNNFGSGYGWGYDNNFGPGYGWGYDNGFGSSFGRGQSTGFVDGYGNGVGGNRFSVRMRGLPYKASESDIAEWFSTVVDPVEIVIRYNSKGLPSGDADVSFASETEARLAMTKNKHTMQQRYIELFFEGGQRFRR